ncbi:uncharacterized protein LOC127947391 isoform X2 [Carassius gibelio]|uniref:uncharacterized protein LOC127947391 isoform X2 n=1 Tax=Carassius gibelio TaxID=101364 RepID=UPI002278CFB1|nr:uncharacterized protein LOC127947391 isoform X2 [Carassius gibelio]
MTKLQLLHRALNERLMAAVEQIMEMVGDTVLEYEEETIRARKENELLRRRLRWMEGANRADWPGPSEPVMLSTMDEASPSRQDEGAANIGFGQQSEALEIKTESTDLPLCIRPESSVTTFPQSIDQGSDNAGTGAGIAYGLTDSMTWDSGQSYMAPLDFDPTPGPSRVRRWRGRNRRQRMSFACPDCGKVFGREQRLMVHMRIHSTERPYAYRRRKACFYGDNRKKRKLHRLSQLSREIVDDLSDGSEQTNRSSASPEQLETTAPGLEEEPESDHTSSDKEPEKRITTSVRNQHEKKVVNQMCHCPHCPHRVFARPCQLAMHMKTHTVTTHVNRPTQAQSGTREIVDVNRNLPKRQRKKNVEKKPKVADNHEHHCPDCDRVFSYASRLRFHMKSHNSKKALLLKTLPIKAEVTKEDTTVAVLKKTYACPHCDKLFTREGWLLPHIRSQHKEVKNRSDYVDMFASRLTRSQQPFTMQFRKRTTTKWGEDTKDLRLKKQKTKESRRSKAKLLQTSDESILVVDVSTVTNDEAEQSADPPTMSTDEAEQSEDLLKPGTAEAEQSEDLLKPGTDEAEQSEDLLKPGTDEAEQSEDLLKPGTDEAEQTEDLLKPGTDEAEQCKDLLKTGTNETEKSEDLLKTGTNEGQKSADLPKTGTDESESPSEQSNLKRMFPCKTCGKEFVVEKRLKKHSRTHVGHKLQNEKKRKRALMEMELEEQERRSEEKERLDDKMSSNHNPSTAMPQGSPKKEPLQKSKTRGQGPLPCPFCGKVFAWEMRLLMHMQIHCGEKPYAYRQRTRRFYGDLKRGQLPKIHSQEPLGDKSGESEESECEEIVNKDRSTHLSSIATHAVSGALASSIETTVPENYTGSPDLLPQRAIEQPTTSYKSNQTTKPELVSDIKSHFNLQPRIVLQPIMTEYKYWSSVPRVADFKSGCFEISSGFDHKQTSYPVLVDDEMVNAVEDKTVVSNFCTLPLEFSSHGIQNKSEICHNGNPETEVVFVEVGSPQHDSEEEPDNIGGPLGIESPEGKDMENQQKDDSNYNFRGVSEKTARNQVSLIVTDDEVEQSNARTVAENALSECGRTKCDWKCECKNSSAMKLTCVMPQSSVLQSSLKETIFGTIQKNIDSKLVCVVFSDVEDNVNEDVLSSSKGLDKKKTAFVPSIQNEQLEVENKSGKNPFSNSNLPALDATEPTKSTDGASQLTEDESISNDPPRNQMAFTSIRQTEERPMSPKERISCQTSDMVFAGQESLSEVHADKKLLDMEITNGDERKNKKLGLNNQGPGCQTNSTDDNSSEFKIHHCFYCNQPHNRMMDHLQSVHPNEPEVAKALTFDKSSQEREQLLNLLQTRGNVLHNTNVVQSSKQDLEPFGKDKSTQNAEDSCGEMLPIAGPIPPAPTLISPSSPEEIDAKIEPSGFHCLNTIYETDFENEQGSSSNPDLSCNVEQPDISSPNDEVRNGRQAEGDFLQFRHSPENEVGYELKSDNSPNPSTGQESTDCKNEGVSLPKCDVDQERAMTPTSDTSPHPEYDVLRNPYDDFSPPKNAPTVSYDTQKSSVKAQTCETGKKRRKRCSHVDNQPLIKDDDLVGEGEMSISKLHVCQHCKATFGSPYMLHRHEHTHTGDTSSSADQEKLKRAKRLIQDVETSMMDEASIEPSTKSPEDLPNAVTDGTGGQVVAIKQDTEVREIQFEEAGQQRL